MDLETYRKIGQNAAKYVKGEKVTPVECTNDPMVRAKYQVKGSADAHCGNRAAGSGSWNC